MVDSALRDGDHPAHLVPCVADEHDYPFPWLADQVRAGDPSDVCRSSKDYSVNRPLRPAAQLEGCHHAGSLGWTQTGQGGEFFGVRSRDCSKATPSVEDGARGLECVGGAAVAEKHGQELSLTQCCSPESRETLSGPVMPWNEAPPFAHSATPLA